MLLVFKKKSWAIALSHLIVNVLGKTITIRNSKWMKNAFYPPFKQCSCIFYPSCLRYINYDCICKYLCCCVVAFFILSSFFLPFFFLFFSFFIIRRVVGRGHCYLWIEYQYYWSNSASACCTAVSYGTLKVYLTNRELQI